MEKIKILHTSDWHLGKRLEGKSRIAEQRQALNEILEIADSRQIDVVIVAGDIFDSANPPAEAEELFYDFALKLSRDRFFVAIAGNHDNAERLAAPSSIAAACNIILVGGMDNKVYTKSDGSILGGEGFVRLKVRENILNLALLPYPSTARMSGLGYKPPFNDYAPCVSEWLKICANCFDPSGFNVMCSHLFMQNVVKSDEYELGTAALLPLNVLPQADYTALGHVHKPQKLSVKNNVYYSGSLLNYSFDEIGDRYINIVSLDNSGEVCVTEVETVALKSGKKPIKINAFSYEEALHALDEHLGNWVQIIYDNELPLSAEKMSGLKERDNFCNLINVHRAKKMNIRSNAQKSDKELFVEYYKMLNGVEPGAELIDMFLSVISSDEI